MLLTLYYLFQHWKLRSITSNLLSHLSDNITVVFYTFADEGNVSSILPISSELCTNQSLARVQNILWYTNDGQRGASLYPKQIIHLAQWITFPAISHIIPFMFMQNENSFADSESLNIYLLIETDTIPSLIEKTAIMIEQFGKLIAWKVDSRLSILLHSNEHLFANLIINTFIQKCFLINNKLPLIRIESVTVTGTPQPFDSVKKILPKDTGGQSFHLLHPKQWEKHLNELKKLSIFASQAAEYEYNKNKTEGKTGIVKPDLIQSTKKAVNNVSESHLSTNLNSSNVSDLVKTIYSPRASPRTSPLKVIAETCQEECGSVDNVNPRETFQRNSVTTDEVTSTGETCHEEEMKLLPGNEMANQKPSSIQNDKIRPKLVRSKGSLIKSKPPNILVYSDSIVSRDSVIATLKDILKENTYTIYPLSPQQAKTRIWIDNTTLLVVCGYVSQDISYVFTQYFLNGGNMLSVCSDLLHAILPTFRTHAEVREHELVQFSYGRWQKVKMMHHIFCYQPSPVKKHFSTDSDEPLIEQKKSSAEATNLRVQILGTEETWNTPSLLLATDAISGGKAIFSQVHLESNPNSYDQDELKTAELLQCDQARLEILMDLLHTYLDIYVKDSTKNHSNQPEKYENAYFLGDHKVKYQLLENLRAKMNDSNTIQNSKLKLIFCPRGQEPPNASAQLLPILVDSCPENFSTVDYFMALTTEKIGRLAIFSPIMTSSMDILSNITYSHGLVVIPRRQTCGRGRNDNQWLSPEGCALFSLQLHINLDSQLGRTVSMIQHVMATAIVNAILSQEGYESLDIGIKWPNDIYAKSTKIGGIIVNSKIEASMAICDIGCGVNLSNSSPTLCINDLINEYNIKNGTAIPNLTLEKALATIFNETERLIEIVQTGNIQYLLDLYYKHWLHGSVKVSIVDAKGDSKIATIIGIDEYGFLMVQTSQGIVTVHPDGNSFDMLQGLIIPK